MKILIACECSGKVRDAFIAKGHDAMSCDFLPTDRPGTHYQGDVRDIIGQDWDMLIAFPTCTYLCVSGLHWNKRVPERAAKTEEALKFVQFLFDQPIAKKVIENPVGCISTRIKKPSQIIQPYEYGDDASKKTCLWIEGDLPLLVPTKRIPGRMVDGKERWANQTDSGQNKLGPSDDREKLRSETYQGIADAMADQWG